ncbi:hypothetical protein ABEB36_010615 [Hypothenemus hampei]|uniref:Transposase n=1 Tax=Hypothenemus hampei TaxID=57062 RepID=A0ABD1ECH6_HYPHA
MIIRECQSIGINIIATVCDQGSNNQSAIKNLINGTKEGYRRKDKQLLDDIFEVDEQAVVPLFDVPHLFKGLRNNLLKYNLCFNYKEQKSIAKWDHIVCHRL